MREGVRVLTLAVVGLALAACATGGGPRPASPSPPHAVALPAQAAPLQPQGEGSETRLPLSGLSAPIPVDRGVTSLNSGLFSRASLPLPAEDLPLTPGDLVEVSVFEVPELSNLKMRIPTHGQIMFPLLGTVRASGRTALQLQEDLRSQLQHKYMHDPQVSVVVLEQKGHRISVLGAVRKPGVFTVTGPLRLADAIAMAEGLADNADRHLYVSRRMTGATASAQPQGLTEQALLRIDLEEVAHGNETANIALQPSDVINVPPVGAYYVGGEVERPGTFPLRGRMTLDQAIITAGGVRKVADWSDIRVYRTNAEGKQELLRFDLSAIEQGQAPPEVRQSDVILVGKSGAKALGYGVLDFVKGLFRIGVDAGVDVRRGY